MSAEGLSKLDTTRHNSISKVDTRADIVSVLMMKNPENKVGCQFVVKISLNTFKIQIDFRSLILWNMLNLDHKTFSIPEGDGSSFADITEFINENSRHSFWFIAWPLNCSWTTRYNKFVNSSSDKMKFGLSMVRKLLVLFLKI